MGHLPSCRTCGEERDESLFYLRKDTGRLITECTPCRNSANLRRYHTRKETRDAHRSASRRHYLKKLYGLSIEQYEAMFLEREGRCDCCGEPETQHRTLAVDHDHATGRIRGLLCQGCNTGIGKLGDTIEGLEKAIDYLRRSA